MVPNDSSSERTLEVKPKTRARGKDGLGGKVITKSFPSTNLNSPANYTQVKWNSMFWLMKNKFF